VCPKPGEGCKVSVRATRKTRAFGRGSAAVPAGESRAVELKLSRKASRRLRRAGSLRVKLVVQLARGTADPISRTKTSKLSAPR
jgi:hypothetical protein